MHPSNRESDSPPGQPGKGHNGNRLASIGLPAAIALLAVSIAAILFMLTSTRRSVPAASATPEAQLAASATPTLEPVPPTSLPQPTAIPGPPQGVQRIVIARFKSANGDESNAVDQWVHGSLLAAAAGAGLTDNVEVILANEIVDSYEQSLELLTTQAADVLIWGQLDADSVRARTTINTSDRHDMQRVYGRPHPLLILYPPDLEFYMPRELGSDMTFLSLVTVGQLQLAADNHLAAQNLFRSALLAMPATLARPGRERGIAIVNFYNGLIAQQESNPLAALQAYSQSLRLYDSFSGTFNNRGILYFSSTDYIAALADFDAALALQPQAVQPRFNRSLAALVAGNAPDAIGDADQLILAQPDEARYYNLRGLIYFALAAYDSALDDFQQAATLAPDSAAAQFNVGITLDTLGRYAEATTALSELLESHPQDALALVYRGDTYLHQGLGPQAVTDYDQALKYDLALIYAYQQRAAYYIDRGNMDVALTDLQAALATGQADARTYTFLGHVYAARLNLQDAEDAYSSALEFEPQRVDALAGRGGVRRALRSFVGARNDLERALELGEPTLAIQRDLGLVYYEFGRYADAQFALEYVIANAPELAEGYAGLAIIVDAQIERDEAVIRLQTALDLDERIADSDYLRDKLFWSFSAISRLESILRRLDANQ